MRLRKTKPKISYTADLEPSDDESTVTSPKRQKLSTLDTPGAHTDDAQPSARPSLSETPELEISVSKNGSRRGSSRTPTSNRGRGRGRGSGRGRGASAVRTPKGQGPKKSPRKEAEGDDSEASDFQASGAEDSDVSGVGSASEVDGDDDVAGGNEQLSDMVSPLDGEVGYVRLEYEEDESSGLVPEVSTAIAEHPAFTALTAEVENILLAHVLIDLNQEAIDQNATVKDYPVYSKFKPKKGLQGRRPSFPKIMSLRAFQKPKNTPPTIEDAGTGSNIQSQDSERSAEIESAGASLMGSEINAAATPNNLVVDETSGKEQLLEVELEPQAASPFKTPTGKRKRGKGKRGKTTSSASTPSKTPSKFILDKDDPPQKVFQTYKDGDRYRCLLPICDKDFLNVQGLKYHATNYVHEILDFLSWAFPTDDPEVLSDPHGTTTVSTETSATVPAPAQIGENPEEPALAASSATETPAILPTPEQIVENPDEDAFPEFDPRNALIRPDIAALLNQVPFESWPINISGYKTLIPGLAKPTFLPLLLGYSKERRISEENRRKAAAKERSVKRLEVAKKKKKEPIQKVRESAQSSPSPRRPHRKKDPLHDPQPVPEMVAWDNVEENMGVVHESVRPQLDNFETVSLE